MKWGKKKPSSSPSSRPFLISQVIPTAWLTKFKHMSMNSGEKHPKVVKQTGKWNSVTTNPTSFATSGGGKFYGGEGDAFWRISFGEDNYEGIKSRDVLRSVKHNSEDEDDDYLEFPPLSCQSYRSKSKATRVINSHEDMVCHARQIRGELPKEFEILPQLQTTCVREKVAEIRTPRLKVEREKKKVKRGSLVRDKKQVRLEGSRFDEAEKIPRKGIVKNNVYEMKPGQTLGIVERQDFRLAAADSYLRRNQDDSVFAGEYQSNGFPLESFSYEWHKLKEQKIEEFKSRNEQQRKSLYISRDLPRKRLKQNAKARVYSPRTAEVCKVKALEDMKKAKLKMKKKAKEKTIEGFQGLESFAVVKCSYDPQRDFRDSMIEMIKERNISEPEELEELLACFLTLNSDEYHDLIIRVFQQVWFELNQACFSTELEPQEFH